MTQKDMQGNWCVKGLPWKSIYKGSVITKDMYEILYGCLCKLMAYEDTGLGPDEVERMKCEVEDPMSFS